MVQENVNWYFGNWNTVGNILHRTINTSLESELFPEN